MVEIPVHIDTLEYTREGLRTREPLAMQVGAHNRIVLVRPKRAHAFAATFCGFSPNSSFPGPSILSLLLHPQRLGRTPQVLIDLSDTSRLQLFGHADATGSEVANKELSDRRAQVVHAMLVGDLDTLLRVSEDEAWGTPCDQVLLRALGCDPGPIDGKHEELTAAATTRFQERYVARTYHRDDQAPRLPELEVDGVLGSQTFEALLDAYLHRFSSWTDESKFLPAGAVGCAAFNPASKTSTDAENRRVSLAVYAATPAYPESAPCVEGNPDACPIVAQGVPASCMWYREHVIDPEPPKALHHHFLPSWLLLTNEKYMLSVLTTLPDGAEVVFEVFASADRVTVPERRPTSMTNAWPTVEIIGKVQGGVAQVVWDPPDQFAPGEDGRVAGSVPSFAATHHETQTVCHASYPANVITILLETPKDSSQPVFQGTLTLSDSLGNEVVFVSADAEPYDAEHLAFRFEGANASASFTLTLRTTDHDPVVLFEDVAFADLHDELTPLDEDAPDSTDRTAEYEEFMQMPEITAETQALLLGDGENL